MKRWCRSTPCNAEALSDLGDYYTEAPAIVGGGKDKAEGIAGKLDNVDRARAEELRGRIAASNKYTAAAEQHFRQAIAGAPPSGHLLDGSASFYQKQNDLLRMQEAILAPVLEQMDPAASRWWMRRIC